MNWLVSVTKQTYSCGENRRELVLCSLISCDEAGQDKRYTPTINCCAGDSLPPSEVVYRNSVGRQSVNMLQFINLQVKNINFALLSVKDG